MCLYQFSNGEQCQLGDAGKGLCYWHDPTVDKRAERLAEPLSELIKSGHCMEGAALAYTNLDELNLVSHDPSVQYSLARADLYHTSLGNAHLYRVNLSGASLMKADCSGANFHFANLENVNLLGTKLNDAKIEHVNWGADLYHEKLAKQEMMNGHRDKAQVLYQQAEETFRHLRKVSEGHGLFELAGHFFIKEMTMNRFQMPRFSINRAVSKIVDIFCGYGERPLRVVVFSICMIVLFAMVFFVVGVEDGNTIIQFSAKKALSTNINGFFQSLYFSVITFTTLGYGDLVPIGLGRLFAAIEAFLGSFTIALFVVVFVKKMTR